MSNQNRKFTEEELRIMNEMENLVAEMKKHPEIANVNAPESLHEKLFRDIRAYEAEKAKAKAKESEVSEVPEEEMSDSKVSRLTEEEMELIRLGKKYKKRKKNKKLYVLIAAAVLAMGLGITSMGGPERVFERFEQAVFGRDRSGVDTDDEIKFVDNVNEEALYQQIEDEYGFLPVRMMYLPNNIEFLQGDLHDGMQYIQLLYGNSNQVNITYAIRPDYRGSSLSVDVEDEILEEYVEKVGETNIYVKKYKISDSGEERWTVEFGYNDTHYYIMTLAIDGTEVKKIIENLYFF